MELWGLGAKLLRKFHLAGLIKDNPYRPFPKRTLVAEASRLITHLEVSKATFFQISNKQLC